MKSSLYCIYDTKANRTTEPFSCPTDEVAKRNFVFGCFASNTPVQDCVLFRVADFSADDTDNSCFDIVKNVKVVNPTLEEVDSYFNIFKKYNLEDEDNYNEFVDKGVVS